MLRPDNLAKRAEETAQQLSPEQIAALIPHGDDMSMLERVEQWDEKHIVCSSQSHRSDSNPLCESGQLFSITLTEYAAQTAAIHAGLLLEAKELEAKEQDVQNQPLNGPQAAYVGALKNIKIAQALVPSGVENIVVKAKSELLSASGAIYHFVVFGDDTELIQGRLVLVLAQP